VLTAALATTSLTACTTDDDGPGTAGAAGSDGQTAPAAGFPVTVTHAFGQTTVEDSPEQVATVGWANHEVPLALGVVPVGMSKATWGDDDGDGVLPWVEDTLAELGADTPVLFDETDAIPFEQIADTRPDVILAAYSGITQDDYDKLSKIAPVVAYPGIPWGTSLSDMVTLDAAGLGKDAEAEDLNASLDAEVTAALDEFPELKDTNVLFTSFGGQNDLSTIGFYGTKDPRAGFLAEAGIGVPEVVQEERGQAESFWIERCPGTAASTDMPCCPVSAWLRAGRARTMRPRLRRWCGRRRGSPRRVSRSTSIRGERTEPTGGSRGSPAW